MSHSNTSLHFKIGEADSATPAMMNRYNCTFPTMIDDWRLNFHKASHGESSDMFPFGFVQVSRSHVLCGYYWGFFFSSLFQGIIIILWHLHRKVHGSGSPVYCLMESWCTWSGFSPPFNLSLRSLRLPWTYELVSALVSWSKGHWFRSDWRCLSHPTVEAAFPETAERKEIRCCASHITF